MKTVIVATSTGNSTTAFAQRPLNTILYQRNPDGTAATLITLASNQFTLPAGIYRLSGWAKGAGAAADTVAVELYDITNAGVVVNNGINIADAQQIAILNENVTMNFACFLSPSASNVYELRGKGTAAATNGFGIASGVAGVTDVFAVIEIWKTA